MKNLIWIAITLFIIFTDQLSKYLIVKNVNHGNHIPVIDEFFYITHHENTGAAWGILQNRLYILIPLTVVFTIIIGYILFKTKNKILKLSLSFVLGGAIGNFIDRVSKGKVVDFLDFYFGNYNFPTFNIADTFIVLGTIILAVYILFFNEKESTKIWGF